MNAIRIVLGNGCLASYPQAGGLWTLFLQYFLGLLDLGHDVLWLELLPTSGDRARDQAMIGAFFERMREHDLDRRSILLLADEVYGRSRAELDEIVATSDLLWNFACAVREPLLSRFRRRVLVDGDPGHLHVSALSYDMGIGDHDAFLTAGTKLHDADCEVPTLGVAWTSFPQFVYLPMWRAEPDPGPRAPFTSVTQWNWGELWLGERVLSVAKRDAYLRYVDLPRASGRPFELAANIHPDDATGDRELLASRGWRLADPHVVAASPARYREYVARSRAEISCPKPIYRELATGWFSDRSACYLASGRPVLAEQTGFGDALPTGEGLVAFRDLEEALAGVEAIDGDYERHSRAARDLAEAHLDSRRCLDAMLAASC